MKSEEYLNSIADELISLRHSFHQIPEVGLFLPKTRAKILEELKGLPLEITLHHTTSGIVAVLRGSGSGSERKCVLLRGDMDGLPVQEATNFDWASTNGNMHACGHDLHMTMLLGAVKALCFQVDQLNGDVVFMFQPGEEGYNGASYMVKEGVLEAAGRRPDSAYAIHVWASSDEPGGVFTAKPGVIMAAANLLDVRVIGKGGHGSAPHNTIDPIPATAEMITALQVMVSHNFDIWDPVVLTVGQVHAGSAPGIIPAESKFSVVMRCYSEQTMKKLVTLIDRLLSGIAAAHGLKIELNYGIPYPATVNDDAEHEFTKEVVTDLFGKEYYSQWKNPLVAGEDFSEITKRIPSCFIGLAACPPNLDPKTVPNNHSPLAQFDDAVLVKGALLLSELALRKLS